MLKQPNEITSLEVRVALENALRSLGYPAQQSKAIAAEIVQVSEPVIYRAQMGHYNHPDAPKTQTRVEITS